MVGKYSPIFVVVVVVAKMRKKVSSRTFFSHLAGPPETIIFMDSLSVKWVEKEIVGAFGVDPLSMAIVQSIQSQRGLCL